MDNLATLVSMGFDIEESEKVLQEDNITMEEAIQRLLEKKVANTELADEKSQFQTSPSSSSSYPDGNSGQRNEGENLVSRFAMSDKQRTIKEGFEKKVQKDAQISARKRKLQDKEAKALVLKEIAANKKHAQQLRCRTNDANEASSQSMHQIETEPIPKSIDAGAKKCKIQVRMPSGKNLNGEFSPHDTLSSVMEFVLSKMEVEIDESESPVFIQPFPRKEFNSDEQKRSLFDLGLCPNASLVFVTKKEVQQCGSSNISMRTDKHDKVATNAKPGRNIRSVFDNISTESKEHRWGGGVSLATGVSVREDNSIGTDNDNHMNIRQSALLRAVLPDSRPSNSDRDASSVHPGNFQARDDDSNDDVINRKNAVIEAIERRALSSAVAEQPSRRPIQSLERDISCLASLSADAVAKSLTSQNKAVLSCVGKSLTQNAANQVINSLKKRKLLTGKILNILHPCKISQLNLNFYSLTSNEILEAARLHSTLNILSLSQCSLITDNGVIIAVRGLKSLQMLDLSGCVQVTDKSLLEIQELSCLRSLKLDKTKVTDIGLLKFLNHSKRTSLLELNLDSTKVTEDGFPSKDQAISLNLVSLFLDHTKVKSLEFLSSCTSLNILSLSGTNIQTESFQNIKQLRTLKEIHLNHTKISNDDLRHLAGLPIRILGLPDRLIINDIALKNIQGLPLVELNLSDYINITDSGLMSIGQIVSLTSLCLANTKITDQGIRSLMKLSKLQELDLSKTQIGDEGISSLSGLRCMQILSLASTRITNGCLRNGTLNSFSNLVKLNLSRNRISDSGLLYLRLPCLEMINADHTFVQMNLINDLKGCPNLKVARAQNCRPEDEMTNNN